MKIVVLMKQVPNEDAAIKIDSGGRAIIEDNVTFITNEPRFDKPWDLISSLINNKFWKPTFWPIITIRNAALVVIPKPPIKINIVIINSPKNDHVEPVSKTTKPVTVTAEVAVNKASTNETLKFPEWEIGKKSKNAPIKIKDKKPYTTNIKDEGPLNTDFLFLILKFIEEISEFLGVKITLCLDCLSNYRFQKNFYYSLRGFIITFKKQL